jgi:ABC-type phosphate/phosphonate transport system substrate-binding protein
MNRFPKLLLAALLLIPSTACAEEPLVVGVASNLILKNQRVRAERVLSELVELIGEEIDIQMKLVVIPSGTRQSVENTVKDVQRGRLHFVATNGIEFSWLRQKSGGRLQPLVVSDQNFDVIQYENVVVRKGTYNSINKMQDASLVLYPDPYPSVVIYLRQLRMKGGASFLAKEVKPVSSGARAIQAVLAGKADATIVDLYTIQGFQKVFPGQWTKLEVVGRSAGFPIAPIIADEDQINKIRPGLWQAVQDTMNGLDRNPRARAFLDVWRVRRFRTPDEEFESLSAQTAKDFPLSALPADRQR